jgi:hypothetical protein
LRVCAFRAGGNEGDTPTSEIKLGNTIQNNRGA